MAKSRQKSIAAATPVKDWVIAVCVAAVALVGALFYARSSASFVITRLLTDGLFSIVWLLATAGFGFAFLRRIIGWREDSEPGFNLLGCLTAAGIGIGLASLITLGLGLAGWPTRPSAIVVIVMGLVLARTETVLHIRAGSSRSQRIGHACGGWRWLWLATGPFLAVALIGTMTPPGLLWTPDEPHGFDVLEYHLQVPREWYEAGRIVPLQHNVFSYLPMGVETQYLLAMHLEGGPWDGMYLAQLMHLWMIVLTVLATFAIVRRMAPNPVSAIIATVALATIPWLTQLGAVAYNDGGLLLTGTLAVGWAMRGIEENRVKCLTIAGALAGLACGVKLTAAPELFLAIPLACITTVAVRKLKPFPRLGQGMGLFWLAGVLLFMPWLARDLTWTGNPLFPEAAGLFGKAHWSAAQVTRWHLANHEPGGNHRSLTRCAAALWDQALGNWQFGYVLLPLSIVALVILCSQRRVRTEPQAVKVFPRPPDHVPFADVEKREHQAAIEPHSNRDRSWTSVQTLFPATMLLLLLIFWLGFTHLQSRFFLLAAPLAAMLIAQVDWGRFRYATMLVTAIVLLAAGAGFLKLNSKLTTIIWRHAPDGSAVATETLGRTSLQWLTPVGTEDAQNRQLTLVGDSRPFIYQMPMSRLHYRTIFDLDTSKLGPTPSELALINVWAGRSPGADRPRAEFLIIDGSELRRYHKTYFDVPPAPPWPADPTVVPPGAVSAAATR